MTDTETPTPSAPTVAPRSATPPVVMTNQLLTLTIGTQACEVQLAKCILDSSETKPIEVTTMSQIYNVPGVPVWSLKTSIVLDWPDPDGVCWFLHDSYTTDPDAAVTFTLTPDGDPAGAKATGFVQVPRIPVMGGEGGKHGADEDYTFNVLGAPTFTPPAP